jgi:hypothetical protein
MAGCGLLSDFHTGGYVPVDSGARGCLSAMDCDDAGEVCCLSSSLSPASTICRPAPCPNVAADVPFPVQLCQTNSECNQLECLEQSCQVETGTIGIAACGVIAICVPVDGGLTFDSGVRPVADAGTLSPVDAALGSSD